MCFLNAVRINEFLKYLFFNYFFFNLENKKSNGLPCYGILGECDFSLNLYCLGNVGAKICS